MTNDELYKRIEEKFDSRFEQIDKRFEQIDERFDNLETEIRHTNFRLDNEIWPAIQLIAEGHIYTNEHVKNVETQSEEINMIKLRLRRLEDKIYGTCDAANA